MRRAHCSPLPTIGSSPILIIRCCSGRRFAAIKIGAIQKPEISPNAFPIYEGGAAEHQADGRGIDGWHSSYSTPTSERRNGGQLVCWQVGGSVRL